MTNFQIQSWVMLESGAYDLLKWIGARSAYEVIMGWMPPCYDEEDKYGGWIARIIADIADVSVLHALMDHRSTEVMANLALNPSLPVEDLERLLTCLNDRVRGNAQRTLDHLRTCTQHPCGHVVEPKFPTDGLQT